MKRKAIPKEDPPSDHPEDEEEEEEQEEDYEDEEGEGEEEEDDDEQYGSEQEENPDEIIPNEPNVAMLAWANLFKDEAKLTALSEQIWNEHNPGKKNALTPVQADKARIALNKEFLKYVQTGQPIVQEEDPDNFPIEKSYHFTEENDKDVDKTTFMRCAQDLGDLLNLFETLGNKLMPAFYGVYEEKYKAKENKPVTQEVYMKFFSDVADKMGLEGEEKDEMFDEVEEAVEGYEDEAGGKYTFDFRTCMQILKDNFYRKNSHFLYETQLFAKYSIE